MTGVIDTETLEPKRHINFLQLIKLVTTCDIDTNILECLILTSENFIYCYDNQINGHQGFVCYVEFVQNSDQIKGHELFFDDCY